MDPETNLPDLTDDLSADIDDLEEALSPLLADPLSTLTSTLPTLDKAKLHILTAYALESLLFQALQASGADAKAHPIFAELARLKTYFGKVKAAEAAGEGKAGPSTKLDKDAAARFIRHGLAGNERYDKERAERLAKEKARAALKARQMSVNKKFDDDVETRVQEELGRKRKAEEEAGIGSDSSDDDEEEEETEAREDPAQFANAETVGSDEDHVDSENAEFYGDAKEDEMDVDSPARGPSTTTTPSKKSEKDKKDRRRRKSGIKVLDNDTPPPKKKAKEPLARRAPKQQDRQQEVIIPERGEAPRSRSETFNALLSGTFAEQKREKKERKDRSKKGKKA